MLTGLFTSSNALQAFQTALDASANNVSNVSTTAFKSSRTLFQDLFYEGPTPQQVGHGVQVASIDRDFDQGPLLPTSNDLDLAIQGQGFFQVQLPNGQIQYSRDGALHVDSQRRLVNDDGLLLQPPLTLPADTLSTEISSNGTVSVLTSASPDTPIVLGQIQITRFVNPKGLHAEAGNRFSETTESGEPLTGVPGTNGLGTIQQSNLEQSNIDMATELVRLSNTSRSFSVNSRAIRAEDQLLQSALSIIG